MADTVEAPPKPHTVVRASAKPALHLIPIFPEHCPPGPDGAPRPAVKICGITHPADAELALELGADALGLNFYRRSPRCLDLAQDIGWLRALPATTPRIAVQLHGDEDEAFCLALAESGVPFIKALRLRDESVLAVTGRYHTAYLLLDTYQPGAYGGTGQTANWLLAARFAAGRRGPAQWTWLSGGLNPENVAAAIRQVRPDGVDVASGVEGAAGPRRCGAAAEILCGRPGTPAGCLRALRREGARGRFPRPERPITERIGPRGENRTGAGSLPA
jgi:phosphoribosylanthranilate isomerase